MKIQWNIIDLSSYQFQYVYQLNIYVKIFKPKPKSTLLQKGKNDVSSKKHAIRLSRWCWMANFINHARLKTSIHSLIRKDQIIGWEGKKIKIGERIKTEKWEAMLVTGAGVSL